MININLINKTFYDPNNIGNHNYLVIENGIYKIVGKLQSNQKSKKVNAGTILTSILNQLKQNPKTIEFKIISLLPEYIIQKNKQSHFIFGRLKRIFERFINFINGGGFTTNVEIAERIQHLIKNGKINEKSNAPNKMSFDAPQEMIGLKFGAEGKPVKKVNFKYFWGGFNLQGFLNHLHATEDYQFIISEEPDYVFFSVFDPKSPNFKTPEIKGPFTKIFFNGENVRPNMDLCDWAFTSDYDEELNHPRHLRAPLHKFYHLPTRELTMNDETLNKIKKQKTKFCNFIYSNQVPFRNRFFEKLNAYKKIDAPGRCCNNMPPLGGAKNPQASRDDPNWAHVKMDFIQQCKFTVAIENALFPGYVTEKLLDPFVSNSVPIYWGNPKVERDFNPKKFIHLSPEEYNGNEEEMIDKLVKKVIEVDQNDQLYEAYLKEPLFPNNKLPKRLEKDVFRARMHEIFD